MSSGSSDRNNAKGVERTLIGSFGCLDNDVEEAAKREGIWPLTADHWLVVAFVKTYHSATGDAPPVVRIGRATGLRLRRLTELFPRGIVQTAFTLAGIPPTADLHSSCTFTGWFEEGEEKGSDGGGR